MAAQGVPTHRQLLWLPHIGRTMPSPTPRPHPSPSTPPLCIPRFQTTPFGHMGPLTNYTKSEATKELETSKKKLDYENIRTRIITIEDERTGNTITDELTPFGKKTHKHSQWLSWVFS